MASDRPSVGRSIGRALFLALMLLSACTPERSEPQASPEAVETPAPAPEQVRPVRVVIASQGTLRATKSASVTIEASQDSRVAAGTGGRVERILYREGQAVTSGQTVIRLDDDSLQIQLRNAELALESARINLDKAERASEESTVQIEAQVRAAEAGFAAAERQYREAVDLYRVGGIAAAELEAIEAQYTQAESTLIQARDGLARNLRASDEDLALLRVQLQQAENQLAQAREALSETRITAPFPGEVVEVYVEEGEFVGAGSPAFRLVSSERQVATFSVPPEDAELLRRQGRVFVRYAGVDWEAEITRVTQDSQQLRQVTLTAALARTAQRIPNGTIAELRYQVDLGTGILAPSSALVAEGGSTYVFIVDGDRARRREIRVLAESGSQAVVEGLAEGSAIIAPRPLDVREDTRVRVLDD